MPETMPKETRRGSSSRTIATLWHNFHFSGRVIMCSVLFGLGLVLIGSLIFAINMDDDSTKSPYENTPDGVPAKPPNIVVGPVVMGIGGFIVIVGIIMCLFETQVCRKRTGDSSPLISDREANSNKNGLDATAVPSTSHSNRHGKRKTCASPKHSKGRHAKSHSKENNQQKSPSPRTPPVTIETPKSFMTSSEDTFLTPPNTFNGHTALVHSNSRNAEIQTSSSLMKSFASSGQSLSQSTEFETPGTSFRDTSVSLDNSMEVGENIESGNMSTTDLLNISAGFLTPVTLEEEKIQEMSTKIQNQEKELNDTEDKMESDMLLSNADKCELYDIKIVPERDLNIDAKPEEYQIKTSEVQIKEIGNVETKNDVTEPLVDQNKQDTKFIGSHKYDKTNSSEKVVAADSMKQNTYEVSDENVVADEKHHTKSKNDQIGEFVSKENFSRNVPEIKENEICNLTLEENTKSESNKDEEQFDLESSVSSDETVVSQGSILEKHVSHEISKEELESQGKVVDEVVLLNTVESENGVISPKHVDVNPQNTQSSAKESDAGPSEPNDIQTEDMNVVKESDELLKDNSS